MIRSRVVMYRNPKGDVSNAVYYEGGGANTASSDGYFMMNQAYDDFGQPRIITVTVDPGNLLEKEPVCYVGGLRMPCADTTGCHNPRCNQVENVPPLSDPHRDD